MDKADTATDTRKIILASSSPRRQELIRSLGLPYDIRVSHADETTEPGLAPEAIVETLSLRKASAVHEALDADDRRDAVIVGSDTIVVLDGAVLGKPRDEEDALRMLSALQGRTHTVYSGIACVDGGTVRSAAAGRAGRETMKRMDEDGTSLAAMHLGDIGQFRMLSESPDGTPEIIAGHTASKVTFRPMNDVEIRAYVKTGEPLDKAGSYGVQGLGSLFIEKIEGDFYSIMGLPLNLLYQMLLKFGMSPFR
jgi:septum formation protein